MDRPLDPPRDEPWQEPAALRALQDFLSGWRFAAFVLSALGTFALLLLLILVVPPGSGGTAAFAEEFRQWCFGWDPATGHVEWAYVLMAVLSPVVLMGLTAVTWLQPLRDAIRLEPRRRLWLVSAAGAGLVAAACGGLVAFGSPETGALPFPAEDLRTQLPAPTFRLTDQDGHPCSLQDLRGRVVLVTGIYARCSYTCPMILSETRAALDALTASERDDVVVVAVTLDPSQDTPATLRQLAAAHGLSSPGARLLSGETQAVERALDDLGITRQRDPVTGLIDHANLFLLLDRDGRLAYRLTLGERQKAWLATALRTLASEPAPTGTT